MSRLAAVTPGLVSVVAMVLGQVLVVVAVAGSPAPWWAAVAVAAAELLAAGYTVGHNAAAAAVRPAAGCTHSPDVHTPDGCTVAGCGCRQSRREALAAPKPARVA